MDWYSKISWPRCESADMHEYIEQVGIAIHGCTSDSYLFRHERHALPAAVPLFTALDIR